MKRNLLILVLGFALCAAPIAYAQREFDRDHEREHGERDHGRGERGDHDRARQAVEEGRIKPLKDILAKAEQDFPGQLIEAELEDHGPIIIYELKILAKDGHLLKIVYDAGTGELIKSKDLEKHR
jgi:uncharacterized membrane protein YkoI